ncbi:hypothetical protein AB0J35_51605 [Nonomuraea angiospora]|uniref:hypothetical protein n=1 Tax=Nonomuraea angiospora TaxID=46172 RepID=UPI0034261B32
MRRHHLILSVPLLVAAAFAWITAAPGSIPTPIIIAVLVLGPIAFVAAVLCHRWRNRRRWANNRSLFDR